MSNKSEATWHPNRGPEVSHADPLHAALNTAANHPSAEAFEVVAALGDTVPREQHDQMRADRFSEGWTAAHAHFTPQITTAKRAHDERTVERDALAHVIEQARTVGTQLDTVKADVLNALQPYDTAPAVSLALHDAEVWDEGNHAARGDRDAAARYGSADTTPNPYRSGAIHKGAK